MFHHQYATTLIQKTATSLTQLCTCDLRTQVHVVPCTRGGAGGPQHDVPLLSPEELRILYLGVRDL